MSNAANKYVVQCTEGNKCIESFIDANGVECVEVKFNDGETLILKLSSPNDPFFEQCRKALADIPQLNLEEAISEGREERV